MDASQLSLAPVYGVKPYFGVEEIDFAIVLGGDGSILDAGQLCISKDIPMIAVNIGNLGYLAEVDADHLDALEQIFSGDYHLRQLFTLSLSHLNNEGLITEAEVVAINEVSVMHDSFQGIAEIDMLDPHGARNAYRCDGLIFATPAGSTAYSLSAGGPILDREVPCICLTPICPHSQNSRPIVYATDGVFQATNTSHNEHTLYACMDGKTIFALSPGESVLVRKSHKQLQLVAFSNLTTTQTLKRKMDKLEAELYHEEQETRSNP
jgi:NAD+ kinase